MTILAYVAVVWALLALLAAWGWSTIAAHHKRRAR